MFSYVSIFDHPYHAVTDAKGNFTIKNVPAGEYEIEAIHRKVHGATAAQGYKGSVQKVKVTAAGGKADFTLNVP